MSLILKIVKISVSSNFSYLFVDFRQNYPLMIVIFKHITTPEFVSSKQRKKSCRKIETLTLITDSRAQFFFNAYSFSPRRYDCLYLCLFLNSIIFKTAHIMLCLSPTLWVNNRRVCFFCQPVGQSTLPFLATLIFIQKQACSKKFHDFFFNFLIYNGYIECLIEVSLIDH